MSSRSSEPSRWDNSHYRDRKKKKNVQGSLVRWPFDSPNYGKWCVLSSKSLWSETCEPGSLNSFDVFPAESTQGCTNRSCVNGLQVSEVFFWKRIAICVSFQYVCVEEIPPVPAGFFSDFAYIESTCTGKIWFQLKTHTNVSILVCTKQHTNTFP